ncbi:uncharacterized protein LOC131597437 [Vicia villosa]|uniref:uncharacterized protein LOC131597437 n=1 Tax=Vicia villosa TaxID=3911 RepID=UPI00273C67F4|nr:uncharacterized protein LOC131597437 [Vicia villosa]
MAGVVPTEMSANSPRRTAQFARNAQGGANTEMKTGILQLVYANPFTGMDHEDPFAHLTKFYEIAGSTGVDAANEESLFKRLFPHSLLGKAKEWQPPPHNNPYQRNNQGFQPSRFNNQHYQHQSPYQSPNPQVQGQQSQGGSSKLEDTLTQFMQASMSNQRSNEAAIKNLENQVGQLAKQLSEQQPGASFSANTQTNPKEHCKAIVTRSGRKVNNGVNEEVIVEDDEEVVVEEEEVEVIVENEGEKSEENIEEDLVEKERKEDEEKEKNTKSMKRNKKRDEQKSAIPSQHLPYPHAKSRKDNARQYARFMDIFKQLQVNIPFSEALEQMPKYAKFMKDILTKKKRYSEEETILLDARCSAIIQKTLPKKEADPGRVTLPVTIGGHYIGNGLVDLGSSINLILLSIIKRLGNIEMKPTRMTLQLADKSLTSPYGVAQDMLVKVDKFLFPVDFVVLDMEEDRDVPLILGRPFMKTARMMIDIDDGLMKVRVQDEEVTFNLFEAMKHPKDKHDTFRVDATDEEIEEVANQVHISSPLERSLIGAYNVLSEIEEKEMEAFLNELESCGEIDHNEEKIEELRAEKKLEE